MDAPTARRMYDLIEPIGLVQFFAEEPNEHLAALGFDNYWDGYFAARSAPLGRAPAQVVDALFYNFAPGEVARHIPSVWEVTTPETALVAREAGCVAGLRSALGELVDTHDIARTADLLTAAAVSAPVPGRAMYAGLRALPTPTEPLTRLWHAATMLREHRGDGHIVALVAAGVGGVESHVLAALAMGMAAERFGRVQHLPPAQLAAVVDGLRARGLVDETGGFTATGRRVKQGIEDLTDELAAPAYDVLSPAELAELVGLLEPIATVLSAAWARALEG